MSKTKSKKAKKTANKITTKPAAKKSDGLSAAEKRAASLGRFADDWTIKMIAKKNPRVAGSTAYDRFQLYKDGMTVGDFRKAGGRRSDVSCDLDHDRIAVEPPSVTANTKKGAKS